VVTADAVRPPAVGGMFYPADPGALRRQVRQFLDSAPHKAIPGNILGIVSPHAGYIYSGLTAAAAYRSLAGKSYETVVVVSPSHRELFAGVSVYPGEGYRTPLGTIPVDAELRDALLALCPLVRASGAGHGDEHAIEVQLPFLQETLGSFALLPLVMGEQRREVCLQLGACLGSLLGSRNALLVASTDLSHYHASRVADAMDRVIVDDMERFDYEQLMTDLESGTTEACGGGPTVAVMAALHRGGARRMDVVHHCNSGDITGDTRSVVGYLSAVAWS
jgi:MEMO1 family protein